jgi:hypothetical protein
MCKKQNIIQYMYTCWHFMKNKLKIGTQSGGRGHGEMMRRTHIEASKHAKYKNNTKKKLINVE